MPLPAGIKKRPVLCGVLVVLALALFWVGYFLATFDLNNYRGQLQDSLEARLSVPVTLGEARLRLRDAGVAITFSDIFIGDSDSAAMVEASDIWLLFEWSALLQRELRFSKIGLLRPTLHLSRQVSQGDATRTRQLTQFLTEGHAVLDSLSIQSLEIRDGRLLVAAPKPPSTEELVIEHLDVHLRQLALGQTATLALTAALRQKDRSANVNLTGSLDLPENIAAWATTRFDLAIDVSHLEGATINRLESLATFDVALHGQSSLAGKADGSLEDGVSLSLKLSSDDLALSGPHLSDPFPLRHLQAHALLSLSENSVELGDIVFRLDGLRLAGDAALHLGAEQKELELSFTEGVLPIDRIRPLLSGRSGHLPLPKKDGSIWLNEGEISLSFGKHVGSHFDALRFAGSVQDVTWHPHQALPLTLTDLEFVSDGPRITLSNGQGFLGETPVTLRGQVDMKDLAAPRLDITLTGEPHAEELLAHWPKSLPPKLNLSGRLPSELTLSGVPGRLQVDLDIQLDALSLAYGEQFRLQPGNERLLQLHGILSETHFDIDHANLKLAPVNGRVTGRIDWSRQPHVTVQGLLEVTDLARLHRWLPQLDKQRLSGSAGLDVTINGPLRNPEKTAIVTLHDVGFSMYGIISDISKLQGKINLTENGLKSDEMLARIGASPVTLQATVADFSDPVLALDVRGDQVRANDLIFYSDQINLLDLKGHLEITPERIAIAPASVRLPGGTRATVTGQVTRQPHTKVTLEIASEFADIQEVIGLWSKMSSEAREQRRRRKAKRTTPHKPYEVVIQARATAGDLYGMQFQNATGSIEQRPGRLLIHPLDFKVDDGDCTAQVIVDYRDDKPPLMRISGHAQDIDAYRIYNELLKQKSILRGGLSGDFYLMGEIGSNYLPSTFGSFDVTVNKGVLRKFNILSKIFSLLNVSQLFALKLPDMNAEGMPFDQISGSLLLQQGVLSSEKLLVKSEAMNQSYVGSLDLVNKHVDFVLAVQPLRTVDKILSKIPIAGWLLTGEEKALITTHFKVQGPLDDVAVSAQPVTTLSEKTVGLIRRTLGLPVKLVTDPSILWGGEQDVE